MYPENRIKAFFFFVTVHSTIAAWGPATVLQQIVFTVHGLVPSQKALLWRCASNEDTWPRKKSYGKPPFLPKAQSFPLLEVSCSSSTFCLLFLQRQLTAFYKRGFRRQEVKTQLLLQDEKKNTWTNAIWSGNKLIYLAESSGMQVMMSSVRKTATDANTNISQNAKMHVVAR